MSGPPEQPEPKPETRSEPAGGFDFNRPTVVSLLYLSSFFLGITVIVGVVLAYVWKGEPHAEWETSHYDYLIRTFWIGLIGIVVGSILILALIGLLILPAIAVLVIVRCVLSIVNAQKQEPMPNPDTWLA
ncbi:MAG: hypothetical protein KDE21_10970 [Novosphingobium sp.]|nr:hypothetical protein [Novosphingobium sp.]